MKLYNYFLLIILMCNINFTFGQINFITDNQLNLTSEFIIPKTRAQINNLNIFMFEKNNCGSLTKDLWSMIKWYLGSSTKYCSVTEIFENINLKMDNKEFTQLFLENAHKEIGLPIIYRIIDLLYEGENVTFAETFSWQGVKFIERNQTKNLKRIKRNVVRTEKNENVPRRDEPDFGSIVIIKSMNILNEYLIGNPRFPFYKTKGNYILIQTDQIDENWKNLSEIVMEKLWKDYGVLDVIILLLSCGSNNSIETQLIGYYDLFSKINKTTWGTLKWININELKLYNGWLLNKCVNFHGYPMKFTIFRRYPTMLPIKELPSVFVDSYIGEVTKYANGYGGLDGLVLGNLAKLLNFKVILAFPKDEYGYKLENGTFTGSIGDILYKRSDVSLNGRFIKHYSTDEIDFLFPVLCDKFCIISPKALKIPQSLAIFLCFHPLVWMTFIIFNIFCGYVWYLLKKWAVKKEKLNILNKKAHEKYSHENDKFTIISLEMWVIMLAGPSAILPFRTVERIFMMACLFANLIIAGTFQGTLATSFSTTSFYKDINSLQELDDSGFGIASSSRAISDIFVNDGTDLMRSLKSKFRIINESAMTRTAKKRDMCCVERAADINLIIENKYQHPDGTPMIHVVKQCPRVYYLSYIVKKGWPYTAKFSMVLRRFSEAGLLDKWFHDTEESLIHHARLQKNYEIDLMHAFNLIDMQTSFYILGIGLLFCGIVFLLEIFLMRPKLQPKKHKQIELRSINIE